MKRINVYLILLSLLVSGCVGGANSNSSEGVNNPPKRGLVGLSWSTHRFIFNNIRQTPGGYPLFVVDQVRVDPNVADSYHGVKVEGPNNLNFQASGHVRDSTNISNFLNYWRFDTLDKITPGENYYNKTPEYIAAVTGSLYFDYLFDGDDGVTSIGYTCPGVALAVTSYVKIANTQTILGFAGLLFSNTGYKGPITRNSLNPNSSDTISCYTMKDWVVNNTSTPHDFELTWALGGARGDDSIYTVTKKTYPHLADEFKHSFIQLYNTYNQGYYTYSYKHLVNPQAINLDEAWYVSLYSMNFKLDYVLPVSATEAIIDPQDYYESITLSSILTNNTYNCSEINLNTNSMSYQISKTSSVTTTAAKTWEAAATVEPVILGIKIGGVSAKYSTTDSKSVASSTTQTILGNTPSGVIVRPGYVVSINTTMELKSKSGVFIIPSTFKSQSLADVCIAAPYQTSISEEKQWRQDQFKSCVGFKMNMYNLLSEIPDKDLPMGVTIDRTKKTFTVPFKGTFEIDGDIGMGTLNSIIREDRKMTDSERKSICTSDSGAGLVNVIESKENEVKFL